VCEPRENCKEQARGALRSGPGAVILDGDLFQDHAYNPDVLDVWTLISYLAADTGRLTVINAPKLHIIWAKVPRSAGRRSL
jgi:hypothetical protein